jgi:hypothetical protein
MRMGFGLVHLVNLVVWLKDMLFIEKHAFYTDEKACEKHPFA